jgi:hypothetical protein
MHKLHPEKFFKAYEQASVFHQFATSGIQFLPDKTMDVPRPDFDLLVEQLSGLESELISMGMLGSAAPLKRALEILKGTSKNCSH